MIATLSCYKNKELGLLLSLFAMPDKKTEKYLAFFLFISLSVLFLTISFLSEGYTGGADNINHYFIARYSFQNPELFFDGWGRPLYTILSSPFAQFGFDGINVFNIIIALLTLWIGYLTAKKLGYSPSVLAFVMIGFAPIYFIMIFTALTEILAGFMLILSVYLFFREKYIWSAVVLSFIYFARAETMIFYPIFLVAFFLKKQYRVIPFLFSGILLFTIIGGFFFKDFLWLVHRFPYPIHSKTYKDAGPLLHFFNHRDMIFGLPLEILLVIGSFVLVFRLFSKKEVTRQQSFYELVLLLAPFAGFFAMHSILYWKALGGSVGYYRVITSVIPLSSLICLKGYSFIDEKLRPLPWMRYLVMAGISCWIISVAFRTNQFPVKHDNDEKVIMDAAGWFKDSEYAKRKIFYADLRIPFYLDINPYDIKRSNHMYNTPVLGFVPDSSIVLWDSHFGPNENGIPRDSVLMNKRFKLLKVFEPIKKITTLSGQKYEILAFLKLPAGQSSDNPELLRILKQQEEESYKEIKSFFNDFESTGAGINASKLTTIFAHSGKQSYRMDDFSEFSPGFTIQCKDLKTSNGRIKVRVSLEIFSSSVITTDQPTLVISLEDTGKSYDYNTKTFHSMNLVVNQWNHVEEEVKLLPVHSGKDQLKVYIYNPEKIVFYIDDLKVEVLESAAR